MSSTSGITTSAPATGFASTAASSAWSLYSPPDRPDLILWWLCREGEATHPLGSSAITAMSLQELTGVNPAKLDLTVPPGFRTGIAIPSILRFHFT